MDYNYDGVSNYVGEIDSSSSDDSLDEDIETLFLLRRKRKRKNIRRFWVHPLWKRRKEQGAHDNLFAEMAFIDPFMFREYIRLTVTQYEDLLQLIGPQLVSAPTRCDVISASQKLMLTLRFLSTGESFRSLQGQFRIGTSTICNIVHKVLKCIWNTLQDKVLKVPNCPQDWSKIITGFEEKWQFPHCWGAMDGKLVVMEAQPDSGSKNFDYKGHHSLHLLALGDSSYKFIIVDVGAHGRQSDGGVFANSNFGKRLANNTLHLPPPSELTPGGPLIPHVCVADEAFPLTCKIMRPFPGRNTKKLPNDQMIYNYRHSRARRIIENIFGIMVSQWRIFRTHIKGNIELVTHIILAAVCLHNFLRMEEENLFDDECHYCPPNLVDRLENGKEVEGDWRQDSQQNAFTSFPSVRAENLAAIYIRDEFKKYFVNEGRVDWQQTRVDEGSF